MIQFYSIIYHLQVIDKMEQKNYQLFDQLNPYRGSSYLKVRVTRIWDSLDYNNTEDIRSLDMLLLDESVSITYHNTFSPSLS